MSDNKPWDIKRLALSLGGEDDEHGFITFEVFDNKTLNIYEGTSDDSAQPKWFYEDIDLRAARLLRDFLNYAVKN